jgi:hypothetical protein
MAWAMWSPPHLQEYTRFRLVMNLALIVLFLIPCTVSNDCELPDFFKKIKLFASPHVGWTMLQ